MTKRIAVLFSPDEAATLMELLRRERAQVRNTRQRPRTDLNLDPGIAPEVYLIRAPAGGIPASDPIGTGTGTADDVNWADCQVYRLIDDAPVEVAGLTRRVYNLGASAVAEDTFRLAQRDKWGTWYVDGDGDGFPSVGHVTVTADRNDWDLSAYDVVFADVTGTRTVSGISGGSDGRNLKLWNVGTGTLVLAPQDSGSSAANRLAVAGGDDLHLRPGHGVEMDYQGSTTDRWRVGEEPWNYVALIPGDGIPALDRSGTTGTSSTDAEDDVPGSAVCDIFRVATGPTLQRVEGLSKTVYNLMPVELRGGMFVVIHRDAYGNWFVPSLGLEFGTC